MAYSPVPLMAIQVPFKYLLVPAPWAVLASGPLPLGRGPTWMAYDSGHKGTRKWAPSLREGSHLMAYSSVSFMGIK